MIIEEDDYPHGLRCMDCNRSLLPGDAISKRLVAIASDGMTITETVCILCSIRVAVK